MLKNLRIDRKEKGTRNILGMCSCLENNKIKNKQKDGILFKTEKEEGKRSNCEARGGNNG
jgi:hypothetical protein